MTTHATPEPKLHAWRIDPAQYVRQESRRGRRHAFGSLAPRTTALIVVDMIPFFVNENPYCAGIVPNIQLLATRLRASGGLVVWVLPAIAETIPAATREFYGDAAAEMFNKSAGDGPLESRLWSEFEIHPHDLLIEKSAPSAFFPGHSPLPTLLEEHGIRTVLVTGTVTNVCCESSARDASTLGYRVIMVADANASGTDESHNATLHTIYRTFGDVRSTSDVIALITTATTPA